MTSRNKKSAGALFLGFILTVGILNATHVFPPEIIYSDISLYQTIQSAKTETDQIRVIKANAVLRLKPKEGSVILKKLPLGALLDVAEEVNDWLKISLPPDEDGFVITGYLHRSFTEKAAITHE